MTRRPAVGLPGLLLLLLVACGVRAAEPDFQASPPREGQSRMQQDAHAVVRITTDRLFARLAQVRHLHEEDKDGFHARIDAFLAPHVDYEAFSRGVMAKYYRGATAEQKIRFTRVFRRSLVRTYGALLLDFKPEKLVVLPALRDDGRAERETVAMQITGQDGNDYMVEYSMSLDDQGWRLRNVVVDGINLGLQFRTRFATEMRRHRNDLDAVIDNWVE